ncbi:MAG TPA: GerMN domain-containing protein, partial [Feifaniaceae bacterium]|nr:GerMN domain-containing protein [Feifaniaceae bacterium]
MLALLVLASFTGCSAAGEYPAPLPESAATPPPVAAADDTSIELTLFFPTQDLHTLGSEKRQLARPENVSRAHAAIEALCEGPGSPTLASAVPAGWTLSSVELSGDVCNIYFTGKPAADDELLVLRAAAAATVYENEGVRYTDVYLNGMQPGYGGNPLGVLAPIDVPLDSYLYNVGRDNADTGSGQTGEVNPLKTRSAQLYFTDITGGLLLCDVRELSYKEQEHANIVIAALLGELAKGSLGSVGREPVLPSDMRLIKCVMPETGSASPSSADIPLAAQVTGRVAELYFTRPAEEIPPIAYASIVYTVTGFWPRTEGVRIYLCDLSDGAVVLENVPPVTLSGVLQNDDQETIFSRADFSGLLGHTVTLLFPDQDGLGLYPAVRCLPQNAAYDPLARLTALFTGPADPGLPLSMFEEADVLSVSIQGNMAVVNFKEGFYEKLSAFAASGVSRLPQNTRAQMTVFAMVNTLASIPGVDKVWMLENGGRIDKSVNMLYLGNPLFYNPGLL